MKIEAGQQPGYLLALALVFLLIAARWSVNGFDFSAFFTAGSDFVDAAETPAPVVVQPGQGYDGQFFYRLALNPFDFSKTANGVTLDFPSYRAQRIVYPLLAWVFSFGGLPAMVPFALVLVNALSFAGIFFFLQKITFHLKSDRILAYLPFFVFGCYMSIAKDLSEVTELFFFTGTIWFMITSSWIWFSVFATLTLLTRETAVIALLPLTAWIFVKSKSHFATRFLLPALPFLVLLIWKLLVNHLTQNEKVIEGTGNLTWPFTGMYPGLRANLDFSSSKSILQLIFWTAYFVWQIWMIVQVIGVIFKKHSSGSELLTPMALIYISWLLFAVCLSPSIYMDDWSFVRVFALWNMTGFLVFIAARQRPGKLFLLFSAGLLAMTVIRLIIKL